MEILVGVKRALGKGQGGVRGVDTDNKELSTKTGKTQSRWCRDCDERGKLSTNREKIYGGRTEANSMAKLDFMRRIFCAIFSLACSVRENRSSVYS